MNTDLIAIGALGLFAIAASVAPIVLLGRDPAADEHTVDDYRPEPREVEVLRRVLNERPASVAHYRELDRQTDVILPPELYGPVEVTEPAAIWAELTAARFLREIAAEQRARYADNRELVTR